MWLPHKVRELDRDTDSLHLGPQAEVSLGFKPISSVGEFPQSPGTGGDLWGAGCPECEVKPGAARAQRRAPALAVGIGGTCKTV